MKDKNTFQLAVLGVFGLFILVGVLYFANGGGTGPDPDKIDYGTVTIWGTLPEKMMEDVIDDIKLTVDIEYKQESETRLRQSMVEALAGNKGPDIVILPAGRFIDYKKYLFPIPYENLSERDLRNTFIDQSEVYLGTAGSYAVPLVIDPMVMYWNRNVFASNSISQIPTLWDEFKTLTPKMTVRDDTAAIRRSTIPFGEYVNVTHAKDIISMLVMQLGAPIISTEKDVLKVDLNSPVNNVYPAVTALEFFTEFSNPSLPTYNWNRSLPSSKEMFIAGDSAVYFGYASELAEIKKTNPHLNFDVALVPQRRDAEGKITYGRMIGMAILNNSDNKKGAFEIIKLFTGLRDNNTVFLEKISQGLNLPPAHRALLSNEPTDPYLSVFYDSALISRSWPDPDPDETDRVFENAVEGALSNRYTLNVAVSGLERQLEQIVEEFEESLVQE